MQRLIMGGKRIEDVAIERFGPRGEIESRLVRPGDVDSRAAPLAGDDLDRFGRVSQLVEERENIDDRRAASHARGVDHQYTPVG